MLPDGIYRELEHRSFSFAAKSTDVTKSYLFTTLDENSRWTNQTQDYITECFAEYL